MGTHEGWADVVIVQGMSFRIFPSIARTEKVVVADLYDPFQLEQLEMNKYSDPAQWADEVTKAVSLLNEQLARADCFLCASEQQRSLWLGSLSSLGRLNPATYTADPTFESFVRVVPFGLSPTPPVQGAHAIKGTVPGIGEDDKVLIWGGGIYNWFDPVTLVEAMGLLADAHPEIKLFFLSSTHFNPEVPEMKAASDALEAAERLGLTGRTVFFNESWVDYETRADYLLDADIGVSTHVWHAETRFSFRTRILDYLWAGLPIVATDGDAFADLIRERGLGIIVPPGDPASIATAITALLENADAARRDRSPCARDPRGVHLVPNAGPAGRVLPRPAPGRRQGSAGDEAARRRQRLRAHPGDAQGPTARHGAAALLPAPRRDDPGAREAHAAPDPAEVGLTRLSGRAGGASRARGAERSPASSCCPSATRCSRSASPSPR